MSSLNGQNESGRRERIVAQLSYLVDEVDALRQVLKRFPDDILTARPYDGEPSVADLFATLADRERSVRLPNVKTLVSSGEESLLPAASVPLQLSEPEATDMSERLNDLISARTELLGVVTACEVDAWTNAGTLEDREVTLAEYLYGIIQDDLEFLRIASQRVHESRPIGSPGFTAR